MEKINLTAEQLEHIMNCFCSSSTCHQKDNTNYDDCPCKCYYAKSLFAKLIDKEKICNNDCDNVLPKNDISERKYFHTLTEKEIKEISDRISEKVRKEIERQFEEIKNKE